MRLLSTIGVFSIMLGTAIASRAEQPASALTRAEQLWSMRSEGLEDRLAPAEQSERALAAYLEAIDAEAPIAETLEARWKALRAAHYLSEFTDAPEPRRDEVVGQATALADRSLRRLSREAGADTLAAVGDEALATLVRERGLARSDLAQIHFWSAIVWGARGQRVGLLTIVRQGIARRIYENASLAIRIDATIERGGAYRLLSRLNADLPKVPFVSGWVDRDQTLPQAEQALAIDPEDPGNRLIVALALLDRAPERLDEARSLLLEVSRLEPRASLRAEDLAIREQATTLLETLRGES